MSAATDRYLAAVLKLSDRSKGTTMTRVAKELRVAPSSASQMVDRLAVAGLLDRVPPGLRLTEEGRRRALFLVRRHRLRECFLATVLGIPWHRVHEEACILERGFSPVVVAALAEHLGNPATCPHGGPIPDELGDSSAMATRPLVELAGGERAVVASVDDVDRELLLRLESLGLVPANQVTVEDVADDGPVVRVHGRLFALDRATAAHVAVAAPAMRQATA